MERLNEAMREMLSRVTVAEQGWQQAQRELLERTDAKVRGGCVGAWQQPSEGPPPRRPPRGRRRPTAGRLAEVCTRPQLDRRELGLVQQQLEEWWQSIQEKLKKAAPAPEANGAAGLRK